MSTNIKSIHSNATNHVRCLFKDTKLSQLFNVSEPTAVAHDRVNDENTFVAHDCVNDENAFVKEETSSKQCAQFEKIESMESFSTPATKSISKIVPIRVRLSKGLKINLWIVLALLSIRHFAPEIAEEIPAVYEFLDTVVLPIINWLYTVALKLVKELMQQDWVASIIEALRNLAV